MTNRENILAASGRFRAHLDVLDELLRRGDYETLLYFLRGGADKQKRIIETSNQGESL
jgi:prephenate dehydrogenase